MKILFFISVHGHGRGGHFHSLNHISQKIGEQQEVKIISLGSGKSDIIESNPHFCQHIFFNGQNFFNLKKTINKIRKEFNPDIYHCFDTDCYNIVRLIISSRKNKIMLNKCGGPNPAYFPHTKNIILFSKENEEWFKSKIKFKNSNICLSPNRVKRLEANSSFHPIKKESDEFTFVRICRIGNTYIKSIRDSINLISRLLERGVNNIKLYIIGVVEDVEVFNKFVDNDFVKMGYVVFLTESKFTNEASKMLYLADAVIGSGRGLMEATSLGKPILAIDKNGKIPVLLNKFYFNDAFETNFSERNSFGDLNQEKNLNSIASLIGDKSYYSHISTLSFGYFKDFFDLDKVAEIYPNAYQESAFAKKKLLSDSILIVKSFYNFYRNSLNS